MARTAARKPHTAASLGHNHRPIATLHRALAAPDARPKVGLLERPNTTPTLIEDSGHEPIHSLKNFKSSSRESLCLDA